MKFICSKSGLECEVTHFPGYLHSQEYSHPIFTLPQKKLLSIAETKWLDLESTLSQKDTYLLYLALFNSTDLLYFHTNAVFTTHTPAIVAKNMAGLIRIVEKINHLSEVQVTELLNLPSFVVSRETHDLACTSDWIAIWNENYADYLKGYKTQLALEKITAKESALERMLKDRTKEPSAYANLMADWAALAGEFHIHAAYTVLDQNDKPIMMSEYWKRIIRACAKGDAIFNIPFVDLNDLIEHCEETIVGEGIFSHALFSLLRNAKERKESYLGLGDIDISSSTTAFRILDASASIEDANKLALIDSAPTEEPIASKYPSKIAFLRAKLNYSLAQEYKLQLKEATDSNEIQNDRRNQL
jgi:hypothetical protein